MTRARELASRQLRAWKTSGALGLNSAAHRAMIGAAQQLGFVGIVEAQLGGCWDDLLSYAIEEVESG